METANVIDGALQGGESFATDGGYGVVDFRGRDTEVDRCAPVETLCVIK
jgi:hypothetical protein